MPRRGPPSPMNLGQAPVKMTPASVASRYQPPKNPSTYPTANSLIHRPRSTSESQTTPSSRLPSLGSLDYYSRIASTATSSSSSSSSPSNDHEPIVVMDKSISGHHISCF